MAQESRLAIVIDSRNAEGQAQDLKKALDLLDEAGIRVTSSTSRAGKSTADAGKAFSQAGKEAKDASNKVSDLDKSLKNTEAMAANLTRSLKYAFAGFSTMALIDAADDWGQYAARMRQATDSTEEYNHAQKRMAQSAKDTYRSIKETRESFIQMSPVLRDMGLSLDQSIDAIDTFSGLLVVNSASAEKGATAMEALAKSMQKGKIDAEAWSSIYSTVDSVVEIIAESSGMAAEEIRKLGAEGKLSIDVLVKALVDGNAEVKKQVEAMPTTVRDALQNLQNGFQEWIGINNEATGVTATLAAGIDILGDNFDVVANVLSGAVIAGISTYVIVQGNAVAVTLQSSLASHAKAAAALAEAKAASTATVGTLAHEAALKKLAVAQTAVSVASRGIIAALGGPVGIAAMIGGAVFALSSFIGRTNDAAGALTDLNKTLDQTIKTYNELSVIEKERAIIGLKAAIDDANDSLNRHFAALEGMGKRYENNDDVNSFIENIKKLKEAGLPIEELENRMISLRNELKANLGPAFGNIEGRINDAIDWIVKYSKKIEGLTENYNEFTGAAKNASGAMNGLSGSGMQEWDKYLKKLTDARDLIGLNARELGEMRAVQAGANDEQAKMAGIIEAQSAEYKKLQDAIRDKDKVAAEAAKENIRNLDIERQKVELLAQQMASVMAAAAAFAKAGVSGDMAAGALLSMNEGFARRAQELTASPDVEGRINQIGSNTTPKSSSKGSGKSKAAQEREEYKDRLEALNEFIATQQELELSAYSQRMTDLNKISDLGLVSDSEYRKLSLGLQQRHLEEMAGIELDQMNDKLDKVREMRELGLVSDEEYMMSMWATRMSHEEALTQLLNDKYLERVEALALQREEGAITDEEHYLLKQEAEQAHQDMLTKLAEEGAINRAKAEQDLTNRLNGMRQNAFNMGVNLLNMFAGKSRAAAIAAIVLQKGLAVAEVIVNTAAAQMRAMAELGPIAGPPMAAKIGVMGKIQLGLIAATGLAQIAATGQSSGGSMGGGTATGYSKSTPTQSTTQKAEGPKVNSVVTINLTGDTFGQKQVRELIEKINDAVSDGATLRLA